VCDLTTERDDLDQTLGTLRVGHIGGLDQGH
jgi:hypothetical protein